MQQPDKLIQVNQSKLYRIGRKADLANVLGLTAQELKALTKDENFKEWTKKSKGKKDRLIEEPKPRLRYVLANWNVKSKVGTH